MKFKHRGIGYIKWGYLFILPFFASFLVFSLTPLADVIRYSLSEYYRSGIKKVDPNLIRMQDYLSLLKSDTLKYAGNMTIMWLTGFILQIIIALTLASWFVNTRLKIRRQQFFKVIMYLPNLIMALAFAMPSFMMFSTNGSVNSTLISTGIIHECIDFMDSVSGTRSLVGLMNSLMWSDNSTIVLMAAIMGISPDIFEAFELDGCSGKQGFFRIILPLIRPVLAYTLITPIIGGLQMFDAPQVLTNGQGAPDRTSMTLTMFLNNHLKSKNYGVIGTLLVCLFTVNGILCFVVYRMTNRSDPDGSRRAVKKVKKAGK